MLAYYYYWSILVVGGARRSVRSIVKICGNCADNHSPFMESPASSSRFVSATMKDFARVLVYEWATSSQPGPPSSNSPSNHSQSGGTATHRRRRRPYVYLLHLFHKWDGGERRKWVGSDWETTFGGDGGNTVNLGTDMTYFPITLTCHSPFIHMLIGVVIRWPPEEHAFIMWHGN